METQSNAESVAPETSEATSDSFEQQVSSVVKKMTQDEKGNFVLPEGEYSDELRYAANAERRRRTTESNLSKAQLKLKAQETVTDKLKERIVGSLKPQLTQDQLAELEDLKYSDPETWRTKVNELESIASTSLQSEIGNITLEASQQAEIDAREGILIEYNRQNPDFQISDEVVKNDIPPRITNKLANNEISFEEFLLEARNYLTSPKKVGSVPTPNITNLGTAGGGAQPSMDAIKKDTKDSYATTIF